MPVGTDYSMAVAGSPSVASYIDGNAILPLPIRVEQTVWSSNSDYYILQFKIFNPTAERMDSLSFGLLWDFDLDRTNDCLGYDSLLGMVYQYDAAQQQFVGLLGLTETAFSFAAVDNGPDSKIGLDKKTKFALIRHQGVSLGSGTGADWMIVAANIFARFEALSSKTTALALIAGTSLDDLRQKALHAVGAYGLLLDAAEAHTAVPSQLELRQNYPNPFNPQTTIDFRLPATQPITLAVYNVIGQKVRTLVEANLPAGEHSVVWDGRDQGGKMVASGVYFYRLLAESGGSVTRKMIMVK